MPLRLLTMCAVFLCSPKDSSMAKVNPSDYSFSENLVRQHVMLERQKRYLLFPDGDPARVQLIIGLGVPVDLEDASVTMGYVLKILYHVPQVPEDYTKYFFKSATLVRAFGGGSDTVVDDSKNNNGSVVLKGVANSATSVSVNDSEIIDESVNVDDNFNNINATDVTNGEVWPSNYTTIALPEKDSKNMQNEIDYHETKTKEDIKDNIDNNTELSIDGTKFQTGKIIEAKRRKKRFAKVENLEITNQDLIGDEVDFINSEKEKKIDKIINDEYFVPNILMKDDEEEMLKIKQYNFKGQRGDELINGPKTTRWGIYKVFENMLEQKGYEGRECILRTICEAADTPFTHKNGVLGELVHILLTPSSTMESLSHSNDKDYHTAEMRGKMNNVDCGEMYPDCEESLLELFSEIGLDYLAG